MKKITCKIFLTILICLIVSCQDGNNKFNKTGWVEQTDVQYFPNRNKMLIDLLTNYKLKGLSYKKLTDLLGKPDKNFTGKKGEIFYPIITKYGNDIDPVYTKTLIFKLNLDSTVVDYNVEEWKK